MKIGTLHTYIDSIIIKKNKRRALQGGRKSRKKGKAERRERRRE